MEHIKLPSMLEESQENNPNETDSRQEVKDHQEALQEIEQSLKVLSPRIDEFKQNLVDLRNEITDVLKNPAEYNVGMKKLKARFERLKNADSVSAAVSTAKNIDVRKFKEGFEKLNDGNNSRESKKTPQNTNIENEQQKVVVTKYSVKEIIKMFEENTFKNSPSQEKLISCYASCCNSSVSIDTLYQSALENDSDDIDDSDSDIETCGEGKRKHI